MYVCWNIKIKPPSMSVALNACTADFPNYGLFHELMKAD